MSAPEKTTSLSAKQEMAIAALLTESTHVAAGTKVGVSEATIQRWLLQPAFQSAYRVARRRLMDDALLMSQQSARAAVACLLRNLECGKPSSEIRAAEALLTHIARGQELMDLAAEIEELKAKLG